VSWVQTVNEYNPFEVQKNTRRLSRVIVIGKPTHIGEILIAKQPVVC